MMDLWKIFGGLDPSLISNCKIAKFLHYPRAGFLVLQNDDVYAVTEKCSNAAPGGSEVSKVESLCGKGIIDFYGNVLGFTALSKGGCVYSWKNQHIMDPDRNSEIPKQVCFPDDDKRLQVCQVSCGYQHNLCLTSDGQVFGWGDNSQGQLGSGAGYERDGIRITGLGDNMVQVAAGALSSFTLDSEGRVWSWGSNEYATLGHGDSRYSRPGKIPRIIENLHNIRKIAVGRHYVLTLSSIGELYFWGDFGTTTPTTPRPTKITTESNELVTDIGSPEMASCYAVFQTTDRIYLWGIWYEKHISAPMATEFTSIDEACASAQCPSMLRPIAFNVQPHGVEEAWKSAFDDPATSDILFSGDNEKLHAHVVFLKLRSEYFRKMFEGDWVESRRGASPIKIQEFCFRVFKGFVYFLYHDKLMDSDTMTVEDLAELVRAADYYGCDDLRLACENKLKILLTPENVSFVYACAVQSNAQNLQDYAAEFIAPVLDEVVKSAEFARMDNDCKTKLMIKMADLNVFQAPKKRRLQ